jgi:2-haloalkanoic acid dehalogenase type II
MQTDTGKPQGGIRGVIFDLGGTLLYFDGDWPEIFSRSHGELLRELRAAGLELDEEAFLAEFRRRLEAYYLERDTEFIETTTLYLLRELLGQFGYPQAPEAALRAALRKMYAVTEEHWKPEEDALPTLDALRQAGYRLALVSNAGDDEDVQALIDAAGIRHYFDPIVTSAAQGIRKPNPRIFDLVLERWGLRPEETAMVGDTLGADILGARNAGIHSVWITRRADTPANRAHTDTIHPDLTIHTLAELPAALRTIHR